MGVINLEIFCVIFFLISLRDVRVLYILFKFIFKFFYWSRDGKFYYIYFIGVVVGFGSFCLDLFYGV